MSRGIIEAQTLRTEQFEFEARTSDPADAQPGEYWFRVDQTSTNPDVIAELRRQDTSGVTTCPIFAASEESNLGTDVTRGPSVVLDDGSVGFIVMATGAGAVGSPRAVNSAGTQYVSHNALELSQIPDSVDDQWPMDEGAGTNVANDIGAVDITLSGATWASDPSYESGYATSYDQTDDLYYTASANAWNDTEYSFAKWINVSGTDEAAFLVRASDDQGNTGGHGSNGWAITFSKGPEFRVVHYNSGNLNDIYRDTWSNIGLSTNNWYFVALAGNGDSADLYIWDSNSQILNTSGTATRGTGGNKYLTGMVRPDLGRYVGGLVDTPFASQTTALTETEFEDLWNLTKR